MLEVLTKDKCFGLVENILYTLLTVKPSDIMFEVECNFKLNNITGTGLFNYQCELKS